MVCFVWRLLGSRHCGQHALDGKIIGALTPCKRHTCRLRTPKEGKMKQYKRGVQYANIGYVDVTVGHNDGFVEQSTQNSAANAAQATNDSIVQNALVGHNDQSTHNNHIATQSFGAPTPTARPLECSVSLYGLLKLNHTTNQTLTANANQYLMCRVDIASQSAYKTVTRAVVKLRQSYCSGSVFPVLPSSANHNILQNYEELNGLDTVVEDGITYKVFDIGSYLEDNTSKTLYFAIDAVDSTFTATSATVEIQYAEEDDLAVNGAELNYSVGAKGSYSVNVRNGKLLYSHALHSAPGNLLPLSLSLNYNVGDIALANKGLVFRLRTSPPPKRRKLHLPRRRRSQPPLCALAQRRHSVQRRHLSHGSYPAPR